MHLTRGRKAFTLIELIVVIVIIGILAAIAAVGFQAVVERSEEEAAKSSAQQFDKEYRALLAFGESVTDAATDAAADFARPADVDLDGLPTSVTVTTGDYDCEVTLSDAPQTPSGIACAAS